MGSVLQGHPYRNVLDLRHGASTSLIELEFASHTGKDSDTDPGVPAGLPFYTLKAQLRELELVFLNRFMQVCFFLLAECGEGSNLPTIVACPVIKCLHWHVSSALPCLLGLRLS